MIEIQEEVTEQDMKKIKKDIEKFAINVDICKLQKGKD